MQFLYLQFFVLQNQKKKKNLQHYECILYTCCNIAIIKVLDQVISSKRTSVSYYIILYRDILYTIRIFCLSKYLPK